MYFRNSYDLQDIVKNINGGDIEPIGDSNYDEKAFERQNDIQVLTDCLIEDLLGIAVMNTNGQASVDKAKEEAKKCLEIIFDKIRETLYVY